MNDADANRNLLIRAENEARARRFDCYADQEARETRDAFDHAGSGYTVPPVFDSRRMARTMNGVDGAFRDATYASATDYIGPSLPMRVLRWIAERTFSQAVAVAAVIAAIVALIYSRAP